jgi:hypothetical protein
MHRWIAIAPFLAAIALALFDPESAVADKDPRKLATVYIRAGYMENDVFHKVEEGSGFLVNSSGWVVTLDHVVKPADMPAGKATVYRGSAGSKSGDGYELFPVDAPVVAAGAQLLRFSPELSVEWHYFKVLANHTFTDEDKITAYGFPFVAKEIDTRRGGVSNLVGPGGKIEVDAALAPGMSGGPVVLEGSRCVVAMVSGGTMVENYNYVLPIQLIKPVLDVVPVEYVSRFVKRDTGKSQGQPVLFDRNYNVEHGRTEHSMTVTEGDYSSEFKAEPGAKIVSARLVEKSAANVVNKSLEIAPDGSSATFKVRLKSGPVYDQWRGWWNGAAVLTEQKAVPTQPAADEDECAIR